MIPKPLTSAKRLLSGLGRVMERSAYPLGESIRSQVRNNVNSMGEMDATLPLIRAAVKTAQELARPQPLTITSEETRWWSRSKQETPDQIEQRTSTMKPVLEEFYKKLGVCLEDLINGCKQSFIKSSLPSN